MWQFILAFIVVLAAGLFIRSLLRKKNSSPPPGQTIIYDSNYQPGQTTSASNTLEQPAYCKHCGGKLDDNASFCSRCGTKIN